MEVGPALMSLKQCSIERPGYWELRLIILTGLLHITIELAWGGARGPASIAGSPERIYNLVVAILWSMYVLWRVVTHPDLARAWGLRWDNMLEALKPSALVGLCALVPLLLYGHEQGRWPLPSTFWMIVCFYPFYGIAQQFALQVLVTRNLRPFLGQRWMRACASACLFSAAHFPDFWLMGLVFPAGLVFTWIYEKHPNIWAVGIMHGMLGALAYYLVLGLDPGAEMLQALKRFL